MENSRDSANNTQNTQDHIKSLEGKEAVKKLKGIVLIKQKFSGSVIINKHQLA